jgi:hypothetical protein
MAEENIIEKGVDWFEEKIDSAKDYLEDKVKEIKIEQIKKDYTDSLKGAVVSHDKLTPELIRQGWKLGLDNVPYNSKLSGIHDPGGIYYDPDADRGTATQATTGGVTGDATGGGGTTSGGVLVPQDLRQRTPSGTMYAPDLSAYEASSLFDYAGPGGLAEYTYGQGLPTEGAGYDIWGTPTDVPNPYYWGQFGEGFVEPEAPGVADGAISLPPIDMPDGVPPTNNNPNVGTPDTNINTPTTGTGPGGKDLTYQETLDYFGLDPVSTTFPGPNDKLIEEAIMNQNAVKETLPYDSGMTWMGGANEPGNVSQYNRSGMEFPADESGIGSAVQGSGMGWTGGVNEPGNVSNYNWSGMDYGLLSPEAEGDSNYNWSGMQFPADESGIGSAYQDRNLSNQKNFEIANSMVGGLLENNIIRNPNQETQSYRGIYVDPRTVPEIDVVQSNTLYPPTMPAGYDEDGGISLVTTTDEPYIPDVPITTGWSDEEYQEMLNNAIVVDLNNIFNKPSGMTMPPSLQEGGDEQGQIFYNALKEEALKDMAGTGYLGIDDYPEPVGPLTPNKDYYKMRHGEAGFDPTEIEPFDIYQGRAMEYGAEPSLFEPTPVVNNNLIDLVHSQAPRINQQESTNDIGILADKMAGGITGHYDYAPGSSGAIDAIVANHYLRGGGW